MPKVSVILPIYNAGSYLEPCLESIRKQTLEDIEVLCVNDGSKDDSLATMQKFADKDARFKVLDKPNGGYGHSLNYGLERATGEYVAIVEPDDFIDPHMYADLYAFAHVGGQADIVKGSYWEYYDGRDGLSDEVREPALSRCMPRTPQAFTLQESPDVFCFHPSIWSAIYSRVFLKRNNIRFVEPKGAGWADNPFFAETLLSAERIVWVPKSYYYYRQTNPAASSFLKDFHVPFDRAREMRAVLKKHRASDDIWAALYLREFNYIYSIIVEFGFNESDPEIRSLIQEVLESMNPAIVHGNTRLRPKDIQYFDDFLANNVGTAHLEGGIFPPQRNFDSRPLVSYVVPVVNHAKWLEHSVRSLEVTQRHDYEVIFVNCGSKDRSMLVCQELAKRDDHFVCLEDDFGTVPQGIDAGIRQACGTFFFVWSPSMAVDSRFGDAVDALLNTEADILFVDGSMRFIVDAMRVEKTVSLDQSSISCSPNAVDCYISSPFVPGAISDFLFNCSSPAIRSSFYRRSMVLEHNLKHIDADVAGEGCFGIQAILASHSVQYAAMSCFENLNRDEAVMPFYLDLHNGFIKVPPLCTPSILFAIGEISSDALDFYGVSLRNLLLESFMYDIESRPTYQLMENHYLTYFEEVNSFLGSDMSGLYAYSDQAFNRFQLLRRFGLGALTSDLFLQCDIDKACVQNDLDNLRDSPTMRVGRNVISLVRSVVPRGLLGFLKSKVDTRGE